LVKPGIFSTQDSHAYGRAFELRNTTDPERWAEIGRTRLPLYRAILTDGIPLTAKGDRHLWQAPVT
jgi:hypothetical protein